MNNWENLILLITNPYFIGLFLVTFSIVPILKYIRRFYPKSYKKAAEESENFMKELQNNKEDKKLFKKANLKIVIFIFGPTFLLFAIYIAYNLFIGTELKPACIQEAFSKFSGIIIMLIGLYVIKSDKIHKWLFKDDYEKVIELYNKQSGNDPFNKYAEKYLPIFGYFFILLGISAIIYLLFFS